MHRIFVTVLLLAAVAFAKSTPKEHRDYVPDEKTAERIADAILVAEYGEERIAAQRPLLIDASNKDYWIVQVREAGPPRTGGGPAVWINKHTGCLQVMEHMK